MDESFDPYYKWLGIPPAEQPPNHYRLLGVTLFESDLDVIANAADQRIGHVRAFQIGKHSDESQRILKAISAARVCLLNADKKAEYDAGLRSAAAAAAECGTASGLRRVTRRDASCAAKTEADLAARRLRFGRRRGGSSLCDRAVEQRRRGRGADCSKTSRRRADAPRRFQAVARGIRRRHGTHRLRRALRRRSNLQRRIRLSRSRWFSRNRRSRQPFPGRYPARHRNLPPTRSLARLTLSRSRRRSPSRPRSRHPRCQRPCRPRRRMPRLWSKPNSG